MSHPALLHTISALYGACRRLTRNRSTPELVAILYHGVADEHREQFIAQVDLLTRRAHVVDLLAPRLDLRPGLNVAITFDDALASSFRNGVSVLRSRGLPCLVFVPTASMGDHPGWLRGTSDPAARDTVLTAEELCAHDRAGVGLGSHTATHPRLSRLDDRTLRDELVGSRRVLEDVLGHSVATLAYPYGDFDARVLAASRAAGYQTVYSSIPERSTVVTEGFHLARVNVTPDESLASFALKISGAYGWQGTAVRWKHRLRSRSPRNRPSNP